MTVELPTAIGIFEWILIAYVIYHEIFYDTIRKKRQKEILREEECHMKNK